MALKKKKWQMKLKNPLMAHPTKNRHNLKERVAHEVEKQFYGEQKGPAEIARSLGLSYPTIAKYVNMITTRWAMDSPTFITEQKQRLLSEISAIKTRCGIEFEASGKPLISTSTHIKDVGGVIVKDSRISREQQAKNEAYLDQINKLLEQERAIIGADEPLLTQTTLNANIQYIGLNVVDDRPLWKEAEVVLPKEQSKIVQEEIIVEETPVATTEKVP